MEVNYSPSFVRVYKKLSKDLKIEVKEKILLFCDEANHEQLKIHKLGGRLKGRYIFSINYKIRIIFRYISKQPKEALLLTIGDHDIYK